MAEIMHLEIAGIHFLIKSRTSLIRHEPASHYLPFLRQSVDSSTEMVSTISLEVNKMPDVQRMIRIFESGLSWSMYINDQDYFMEYRPPVFHDPFWIAHIDSTLENTTVYCGERFVTNKNGRTHIINPVQYPLDQLLLMHILAQRNGGLLHASGIDLHGRGFIFAGRSGAGKSTLSGQFLGRNNIKVFSDDRIVIRKTGSSFMVFGTPWAGDAGIAENKSVPLSGIFFIRHGNENRIEQLEPGRAFEQLMPVTSIPWYDKEVMLTILSFCEELVTAVPAYELSFKPDNTVVDFFEEFISQEEK